MPALPFVANTAKVIATYTDDDAHFSKNIFHYQWGSGVSSVADMQALAAAVYEALQDNWVNQPVTDANLTIIGCDATDLSSGSAPHGTYSESSSGGGTGQSPAQTAALISWLINRRYRGGKPRTYLPGPVAQDYATPGTWDAGVLAAVLATANALRTAVPATSFPNIGNVHLVNVSYYSGFHSVQNPVTLRWKNIPTLRVIPTVDIIVGNLQPATIATQRRRVRPS